MAALRLGTAALGSNAFGLPPAHVPRAVGRSRPAGALRAGGLEALLQQQPLPPPSGEGGSHAVPFSHSPRASEFPDLG